MASFQRLQGEGGEAQEVARILLAEGAVSINAAHPFVYASGIVSPIYCDLRLLMGRPWQRERIVELLAARVLGACDVAALDVIAGVVTAGVPWAAWVASRLNKPMAYVREAAKGHGKRQQVEGGVTPGQVAIVIEDLTSTGASALTAVEALRGIGAQVGHCFSIFTYELPQASDSFCVAGVELACLCGISTLLEVATSSRQITGEEARAVQDWLGGRPTAGSPDSSGGPRNP